MDTSFAFLPFGKDDHLAEAEWPRVQNAIIDEAVRSDIADLVLTPEAYTAFYNHAYEPLPDPGPPGNAQIAAWVFNKTQVKERSDMIRKFKKSLLLSLGPVPLRVVQDADGTKRAVTITMIHQRLQAAYGTEIRRKSQYS